MKPVHRNAFIIGAKFSNQDELVKKISQNFAVETYQTIEAFIARGKYPQHSLYIISDNDIGISPFHFIKLIRLQDQLSVIYHVSPDPNDNVVTPFVAGADFCSTAPVEVERFLLEVQNSFKKLDLLVREENEFELNDVGNTISRSGQSVRLTSSEFRILKTLFKDRESVHSRDILLSALGDGEITPRTVDVHISCLRKKLEVLGFAIETVRGAGYRLVVHQQVAKL